MDLTSVDRKPEAAQLEHGERHDANLLVGLGGAAVHESRRVLAGAAGNI